MALGGVRADIIDLVRRSGAKPKYNGLLVGISLALGTSLREE
jgi:hypothetical protein